MRQFVLVMVACFLLIAVPATAQTDLGKGQDFSNSGSTPEVFGGPDGFGYRFIDSSEPNGPAFSFVDISGTGTAMGLTDDGEGDAVIGFAFNFYGNPYTDARIGNNGGIFLGTPGVGNIFALNACPLPDAQGGTTAPRISVFWDDVDSDTGDVFFETQTACAHPDCAGQCFVVQWDNRPHFSNVGSGTFEAILCDSGDLIFQYLDLDYGNPAFDFGATASVGIEDEAQDATFVLQYSCNTASLSNNFAVRFTEATVPVELQTFSVD